MEFNFGTLIAVAAALFFYLRLIILQRQKVKKTTPGSNKRKKDRETVDSISKSSVPLLRFSNPYLLGIGAAIVIFGAVLSGGPWFSVAARAYWWIPVTIGIMMMSFAIR